MGVHYNPAPPVVNMKNTPTLIPTPSIPSPVGIYIDNETVPAFSLDAVAIACYLGDGRYWVVLQNLSPRKRSCKYSVWRGIIHYGIGGREIIPDELSNHLVAVCGSKKNLIPIMQEDWTEEDWTKGRG